MNQITITSIKLDGHSVKVPEGLSELFANTWVAEPRESKYLKNYDRTVIKRDGHFVTVLKPKEA